MLIQAYKEHETPSEKIAEFNIKLQEADVQKCLLEFTESQQNNPMFKCTLNYMEAVHSLLDFISATQSGNLLEHLSAGQCINKIFFAMDRLKLMRLWPRYLSDMEAIQYDDPQLWDTFIDGNLVFNKSDLQFVALGADQACEQLNKWMKQDGGVVGISSKENARQKFFLIAYECCQIAKMHRDTFLGDVQQSISNCELSPAAIML
jgi:hypothetical protein